MEAAQPALTQQRSTLVFSALLGKVSIPHLLTIACVLANNSPHPRWWFQPALRRSKDERQNLTQGPWVGWRCIANPHQNQTHASPACTPKPRLLPRRRASRCELHPWSEPSKPSQAESRRWPVDQHAWSAALDAQPHLMKSPEACRSLWGFCGACASQTTAVETPFAWGRPPDQIWHQARRWTIEVDINSGARIDRDKARSIDK